jgi:iron complex outermembrane receptor protein
MKKTIITVLSLYTFVTGVLAQHTTTGDSVPLLKEVQVGYQAKKTTPVTFQNVTGPAFKAKLTGQEPSFLLAETPGITAYSDAGNTQGYSYYRIRGIDQTRINTTLDGMPLNEPEDQGAYFSNYPDILNSVSKIQIQRGSGTTKNGVASYGGSIELFTPSLYDTAYAALGINYGSFNSLRLFGVYNSGIKNHKAFYARASQVQSNGYKYHAGNNSQSVFVSTGMFYNKTSWKLNVLAGHQKNELAWLGVADTLIAKDRKTNANTPGEKDAFTQALVQLQNKWTPSNNTSIHSSIYYTHLNGNYNFDFNNFLDQPITAEMYNYAFKSHLTGFFSNAIVTKNNFSVTAGLHGQLYHRRHNGSEKALGHLYTNTGYKNEVSYFAKASYNLQPLTLFADVQYRSTSFRYTGGTPLNKRSWQFLNPKTGVALQLNNNSVLYYGLGYTGREPTRNDMFGGNDDLLADSTGQPVIAITDAEYVLNHEMGWRFQNNRIQASINVYYMNFKNEIVLNGKFGPNGLALTNNVQKSFRSGLEIAATYTLTKFFALQNNTSFNYSRIKEQGQIFSPILTPPVIINQDVIYQKKGVTALLQARYQKGAFINFANTAVVKSYVILNARLQYQVNKITMVLFLQNITNTKYFNNGYTDFNGTNKYFVQAPVNYTALLQYNF